MLSRLSRTLPRLSANGQRRAYTDRIFVRTSLILRQVAQAAIARGNQVYHSLPLVYRLLCDLSSPARADGQPLKGQSVLLIQHQLAQHIAMVRGLMQLGVAPEDVYSIDIPYTASDVVKQELCMLGVPRGNVFAHDYTLSQVYT